MMTALLQDRLGAAARAARRAHDNAAEAAAEAVQGEPRKARQYALEAKTASRAALDALSAAGVEAPQGGAKVAALEVPLRLLDTPANRELLSALRAAAAAGAAVDVERGWTQDGEPCGWGEMLAGLAAKVEVEIHGPTGRD